MTSYKTASLLYAAYYLQILLELNDNYLHGRQEQADSLRDFELEFPNISSAREKLPTASPLTNRKQDLSKEDFALLDLCNAFPDAGAYLINVKLNVTERIRWLEKALQASQQLKNDITTQAHLGNLGLAYYELGKLTGAVEYLSQALTLAEKIGDKNHQGAWLGNLGNVYALQANHEKAIQFHQRHLYLAREVNDVRGERHALANLGVSHAYLGHTAEAVQNYKQFLDLAVKSGDRREESQALMNLGFAYYDMGNLEEAEKLLQDALSISIDFGDKLTQCLVMGGIADVYIDRREFKIAMTTLSEAIEDLKESYDVRAELRLFHSLGNAYTSSEDYPPALEAFSHMYKVAESIQAKAWMCSALANQTSIYRQLGRFDTALKIGKRGLSLARESHSLSDEVFIRWQIALIYEARGNNKKAIVEMKSAIKLEAQIYSPQLESHQEHLQKFLLR